MEWIRKVLEAAATGSTHVVREEPLAGRGRALALAPHPDDPDSIAVTLLLLHRGGWEVHWAILTTSWSGVEDRFVGPDPEAKGLEREREQRASAALFGLPLNRLSFLRLAEDESGSLEESAGNRVRLFAWLDALAPGLVLLPHGEDTNATHRLTYRWLLDWVVASAPGTLVLGNEDPKTISIRPDLSVEFGETTAVWKASLLECHRSQSERNRAVRNMTFADRILAVNRRDGKYCERFQAVPPRDFHP